MHFPRPFEFLLSSIQTPFSPNAFDEISEFLNFAKTFLKAPFLRESTTAHINLINFSLRTLYCVQLYEKVCTVKDKLGHKKKQREEEGNRNDTKIRFCKRIYSKWDSVIFFETRKTFPCFVGYLGCLQRKHGGIYAALRFKLQPCWIQLTKTILLLVNVTESPIYFLLPCILFS